MGVIVAAGPGKKDEEMKLAVGDKVVYFKYAGDKMTVRCARLTPAPRPALTPRLARQDDKGTEFVVLHQNDILGKL